MSAIDDTTLEAAIQFPCDVGGPAVVRVIRDEREWDATEREWDVLFAQSPSASPPLRFRWLREWWRIYGPVYGRGGAGLRIITVRRGARLIGALPLYERSGGARLLGVRRLGFLSTGEAEFEETCAEYLDLLYVPGEEAACLDVIGRALLGSDVRWDELDLCDVPAGSPLVGWMETLQEHARTARRTRGACAIADISGGLDEYLSRVSSNRRQQSRRLMRAAERAGVTLETAATVAEVAEYFDQLVDLHQRRWARDGQPGCFAAERFTEFHRELARAWVPGGHAVLARLVARGKPLAVIYGFVVGDKFDFYQSGVLTHGPEVIPSPGIAGFLLLMKHLAGRGVARFDFLRAQGEGSYKHRLSTHECPLYRLVAVRPSVRGWARGGVAVVRRIGKHAWPRRAAISHGGRKRVADAARPLSRTDLAAGVLAKTGLGAVLRAVGAWRGVLALAYHRIGDGSRSPFDRALWSATADEFDAQVRLLKRHVDVIGADELAAAARDRRGRFALITFDDGYRDNYEVAMPILKAHGLSALFFLATGFLDEARLSWWDELAWMVRTSRGRSVAGSPWLPEPVIFDEPDREKAIERLLGIYKSLPGDVTGSYLEFLSRVTGSGRYAGEEGSGIWMTWDMAREMSRLGMRFGGHTVSHPILARLPRERQSEEIAGCARRLREELGQPMRWFSYPRGKPDTFDGDTRACLQENGVEAAFTAYGGLNGSHHWDPYDVRRSGVEMNRSPRWLKLAVTCPQVFA